MIPCYRIFGLSCLSVSLFALGCGGGSGSSNSSGGGTGNNTPPTPTVTSISPPSVMAGSATTQLTVNGTNFQSTSTVQVGGVADVTSYVNSKQLVATVSATQIASGGQLSVIVLNGSLSSGSGAPINFEVDNPAPTISSVSPARSCIRRNVARHLRHRHRICPHYCYQGQRQLRTQPRS